MKLSDRESAMFQRLARQEPELVDFLSYQRERVRDGLEQAGVEQSTLLRGQAVVYRELLQCLIPTR